MGNRILLIGYNFSPELTGIGKYSGEMIEWLARKGYRCTVLTTYPYYPYWRVQEPYRKKRFWYSKETTEFQSGGKMTIYRCPMYVPSAPTGKKRILLDLSFFISAFFQLLKFIFFRKFELIITVVPSFQLGFLGDLYKRIRGGKHIYHIQDLQIEVAQDLNMITSGSILNLLFRMERYILDRSDVVSSISEAMVAKIGKKTKARVQLFPNWVDVKLFFPLPEKDSVKELFGFRSSDKIILYSGAIGEKQGLESILLSARELILKEEVKFIICGTGPYKAKLEALAVQMGLENVIFLPLQPKDKFNAFLNMADVHLVIQKAKASDLVMPSKLTSILAVGGLALITANQGSGLHDLIDKCNMAIHVEAENQLALNEGISRALSSKNSSRIRTNALQSSKAYLSKERIMESFEKSILHN